MNKLVSIIRIAVLLALGMFAFLFLCGEEQDENLSAWMFHFLVDKALAFLAFYVIVRLYKRWRKVDPWLKAYDKMCEEDLDQPNPAYIGDDKED